MELPEGSQNDALLFNIKQHLAKSLEEWGILGQICHLLLNWSHFFFKSQKKMFDKLCRYILSTYDDNSEIRDQRSEIRDQRSEIRDQRSEIRDQRSEAIPLNFFYL